MVGVKSRAWAVTAQGARAAINLGGSLREGFLEEVVTCGPDQGMGGERHVHRPRGERGVQGSHGEVES